MRGVGFFEAPADVGGDNNYDLTVSAYDGQYSVNQAVTITVTDGAQSFVLPNADADGYVTYSNVNAVEEMVNMISASRSYQNNIEVMNTAKSLLLKTLQLTELIAPTQQAYESTAIRLAKARRVIWPACRRPRPRRSG